MANRNFNRRQALEKEVKDIYAKIAIGAAGAASLVDPIGVESITKTGTGAYRIVLQDRYIALKHVSAAHVFATDVNFKLQIAAEDVAGTSKSIDIITLESGVAADLASGVVLLMCIELKNSSAK